MKKYIIPQTVMVQVQPQTILAGSDRFIINTTEEMGSDEMEAKKNHTYNVWEDEEE